MNIPKELKYTKTHEWVQDTGEGTLRIGLTDYAQHELGDLVFVNLPSEGDGLTAGLAFADVESVKAVSDIYSPVTGTVVAVNEVLLDDPALINSDPYDAWLCVAGDVGETEELLSAEEYEALLAKEG
ncbi:glycine cleavage system protein GcvH [Ruminococcaceae bacterium OttesenSCG-928-O06]|nr:glycine cleavage system protein GcvH [Ruminococcaceae bacterium OttesenSCG-928-O06]